MKVDRRKGAEVVELKPKKKDKPAAGTTITAEFELFKVHGGSVRYNPADEENAPVNSVYLNKAVMPDPNKPPKKIKVTFEF